MTAKIVFTKLKFESRSRRPLLTCLQFYKENTIYLSLIQWIFVYST